MNECALVAFAAAMTSSRVAASLPYAMFSNTLPWNNHVSCSTIA